MRKGQECSISGCSREAVRSISPSFADALAKAGLSIKKGHGRIYLCEEHYKAFKKVRRKEAMLERWRMTA
ncbi:MAG: hypothetical protein DRJ33_08795 [Candidatus Methanomethylicota archaeon]|uniref:Uncharacterized protein n=1 Tax=Thermoproteota archaeon TaxID=2056631 RepID=A0A497EPS9_9CREN|nr:MAG: hypothetical protein DRJ33_08795 [Candidatus Verstraetearchaeota archaeon]